MTANPSHRTMDSRPRGWFANGWATVLDLALVLWVVRVPFVALLVGLLVLGLAPQAQDLIVELAPNTARVVLFFVLLALWVAITAYAAFLLLATDQRFLNHARERHSATLRLLWAAMPCVLGAMPFLIVLIATVRSYWNLPDIDDVGFIEGIKSSLRDFMLTLAGVFAVFVVASLWRPAFASAVLQRLERGARRVVTLMPRPLRRFFAVRATGPDGDERMHYFGPLLLVLVFFTTAFIFLFGANTVAGWLPRALIVPVVLGGWLPLLTWLSAIGRRYHAPLISGSLFAVAVLSALIGDNHSVRRISGTDVALQPGSPVGSEVDPDKLPKLDQAVRLWMKENHCDQDSRQCPRPIIVAGAGGASRAGFFTASVIGRMLDQSLGELPVAGAPLDPSAVRNRIFAISGVSGSAVGAVMTVAALARSGPATRQPCTAAKTELWYGEAINNWQDCLEALTAGDFLTPVVIGLIFNDRINFAWWEDRAAVLERSWEDRFAAITAADAGGDWRRNCPGDLRCPFMSLRPKPGHWLPLLVLNGASAATGRRIITSALANNYLAADCPTRAPTQTAVETQQRAATTKSYAQEALPGACLLFLEAIGFHKLQNDKIAPGFWAGLQLWLRWDFIAERLALFGKAPVLDDVLLSTAAHNSARFPIISPPGAIRNREHQIIDRIVDGGYVENYGALTAMELAQAIHAIEPELAPFVLAVSNDPDDDPDLNPLDAPDASFLSDLVIPIEAIAAARTGHGRLALGQVEAVLDHLADAACGAQTARVRVWPQFSNDGGDRKISRPVSMSWWLSQPIQIHLHQQTEPGRSQNQNHAELLKLRQAIDKPAGCVGRPMVPSTMEMQRGIPVVRP